MKRNPFIFMCTLLALALAGPSLFGQTATNALAINPESIMRLTMDLSARIEAEKHQLASAQYNYDLFESKYTQFTPLKMNSEIEVDQDEDYEGEISVGMEKEFFDGSSIGAYLGQNNLWGEERGNENSQFVRTEVQFPLFSSNRKLRRITERTFEENELYNAQLDYVNTVRQTIRNALEMYYDYVPRAKSLEQLKAYKSDLEVLQDHAALGDRVADQQQLGGEINSLTSDIQGMEVELESLLIEMQRWIGNIYYKNYTVESIDIDFTEDDYFGQYYISAPHDVILEKAIQNDTELRVLELIKLNALEKKRLAEKGKWDIFLSLEGQYNYRDETGDAEVDEDAYYEVLTGLSIKRFDKSVLHNTIQMAEEDILYIETTMKDRRIEMESDITRKKANLLTKKEQVLSSRTSLDAWQQIHDSKLALFLAQTETVDNYIQAFRSLRNTMEDSYSYENRYFDTIRDFDFICGVYFQFLGIEAF